LKIGNFGKEAASLDTKDIGESVRFAVDSIRKLPAIRRRANVSYSLVVKSGYEEIHGLREDGYSYDLICEVFAQNGLLSERANPKALCNAFLREKKRREKKGVQEPGAAGKNALPAARANLPTQAPAPEKQNPGDEAAEKERIRKLTGNVVDTGLGKIIKHSDGSFEYN
jgi:hypothetical protein